MIHSEGRNHLAVLGGGADQDAPARAMEEGPEPEGDERAEDDDGEIIAREELTGDGHGAAQAGGGRARLVVGAPEIANGVRHDQDEREGQEELVQLGRAVDAAKEERLHEPTERRHEERGEEGSRVEGARAQGKEGGQRVRQVGRQHVEGAVGKVDDPGDPEDERQSRRDEEEEHRVGETAQELDDEERHGRLPSP